MQRYNSSELLKGFGASTFWGMLSKCLMFVVTFYCSNTLTQEGFGEYSYIKNTLDIIILICVTNFSSLAIKFAAELTTSVISLKRLYILLIFIISISIVVGLSILFCPYSLIQEYTRGESVAYYIKIIALFLPLFVIHPFTTAILRGFRQFNLVGKYEVSLSLIYVILILLGIEFYGYRGAIVALICYYLLFSIVGIIIIYTYNRKVNYLVKVNELSSQLSCLNKMILPVFFMSFIEMPITWLAQTEVARRGTYSLVACLTVISTIRYILQILPTYFYQSFTPFITLLNATGDYVGYFYKLNKVAKMLAIMCVIIIPFLLLFGRLILSFFNDSYVASYSSYIISICVLPLSLYSTLLGVNMMVREHQVSMVYMSILSSISFLCVFYILLYIDFDVLKSFFVAQGALYFTRVLYSLFVYNRDKRKCLMYNA